MLPLCKVLRGITHASSDLVSLICTSNKKCKKPMSRSSSLLLLAIFVVSKKYCMPGARWYTKCLDFDSDIPYGLPWFPKCLPQ